ncbi:MAG: hypothetical protein Q8O79_00365 [Pseudomonadota bacterium]|nr:hypothetical protein [Pseudomonadota bacterium]
MGNEVGVFVKQYWVTPRQAALAVKMWADADDIETYWGYTEEERRRLGLELAERFMQLPADRRLIYVNAAKSIVLVPWWSQLFYDIRESVFHTNDRRSLRDMLGDNKSMWTSCNMLKWIDARKAREQVTPNV